VPPLRHHRAGREPQCQPAGECQAERIDPHRQDRKSLEQVLSYALSRHSRGNRACEKTHSTQITGHPAVTAHSIAVPSGRTLIFLLTDGLGRIYGFREECCRAADHSAYSSEPLSPFISGGLMMPSIGLEHCQTLVAFHLDKPFAQGIREVLQREMQYGGRATDLDGGRF
jgi:hypothetical protein